MSERMTRIILIIIAGLFLISTFAGVAAIFMSNNPPDQKPNESTNQSKDDTTPKLQGTQLTNFTPVAKIENLEKIDQTPGTGTEAKAGSTVTAHYTGAVAATGVIFQSSLDTGQPVPFSLDQVIKGWTEGVPGMKVGGTRRLLIPANMAYGSTPPAGSGIPANADLVFDITLVDVK